MSNFKLKIGEEIFDLLITTSYGAGGSNSIVVKESPGSPGGFILNLGRRNEDVTLTGKLLSNRKIEVRGTQRVSSPSLAEVRNDINAQIARITEARDRGRRVQLLAPINDNRTGNYNILTFTWDLPGGVASYVNFTLILREERQVNVKRSLINLVGAQALDDLKAQVGRSLFS